jgi:hypothetical protein
MSLHSTKSLIFAVLEKFSILQFPKMGKKMRVRERERERERERDI